MKTFRSTYALLLAGALSFTQVGCKDALDLEPLDQLSDASYWKTPNDYMLAANQFYTFLRNYGDIAYNTPGGAAATGANQNFHSDFKSDLVVFSTDAANPFSRGTNTLQATDNIWNSNYTNNASIGVNNLATGAWSRIRVINYLLDKSATYPNPAEINKYVGEARFFRAYIYFDLLQLYGGVPIITKALTTDSPELQAPRNTREQVADFIIQDLTEALALLPAKTGQNSGTDLGRINKEAVQAFLGRVTLYEGTWQKFRGNTVRANALLDRSIAASNAVMTGGQYQLFAPTALGDSAQKYLFILENQKSNPANLTKTANNEFVLANRFDQTIRQGRVNISRQSNNINPTKNFVSLYLCQDGLPIDRSPLYRGNDANAPITAEFRNRDNRMRHTVRQPGRAYWFGTLNPRVDWTGGPADLARANTTLTYANSLTGYHNLKWIAERDVADNEEGYDYPVIRYAEVLLNYAEAQYERNGLISDGDLDRSLNLVRNRVNRTMPKLSNAFVGANSLDMRTEIRRERTIELYLEGFRLDDLKRWNTAVQVLAQPIIGTKWTGTQYQTLWTAKASTPKDANGNLIVDNVRQFAERNYLNPIPTQQILYNPQLEQNPSW
jgi:starch-binding outer membrane protein, SusD/RagB family